MKKTIVITLAFAFASMSHAASYDQIFKNAGTYYGIDPLLIKAHCMKESGLDATAYNDDNSDNSVDIGLCQINSWWYPKMEEHNITPEMLNNPAISIYWAAYVINHNFSKGGVNLNSIGAYNAGWTEKKKTARIKYANEVIEIYRELKKGG